eukprot:TRINITY_DN87158_c0_g1_i1.p2 TRINITY_DN87158_c0_g1~~TRINITY_DN87158_c0_g1_i1.p2  ORF type:complete len:182 (-),score=14.10 TRINITY_DN87158_c0_g1_i1:119-664(-)
MQQARSASKILVDNRPQDQFLGLHKHGAAQRYGTIPGAKNLPEDWLIDKARGTFRDTATVSKLYQMAGVPTEGEQISFCNTGHWASLGWFVSHELLGNDKAKLYDGSMVEWSADKTLEMHTAVQWQAGRLRSTPARSSGIEAGRLPAHPVLDPGAVLGRRLAGALAVETAEIADIGEAERF